jgi:death-on-curing protein
MQKLESALAQPRQMFSGEYLHGGLPEMAAAYAFHLVQNHPFEDGNKRTGAGAALLFLAMNDLEIELPTDEAEALILAVASGKAGKPQLADFFRRLLREQHQFE